MHYGQACRQTLIYRITEGSPVTREECVNALGKNALGKNVVVDFREEVESAKITA